MTTTTHRGNRNVRDRFPACLAVVAGLVVSGMAYAQAGDPAVDDDETKPDSAATNPPPKRRGETTHLGLSPQTTAVANPSVGPPAMPEALTASWGFRFHGFFRGPMRLSMDGGPGTGPQFHAPPVTPDSNYTTWSFTNNNPGPWAELLFQYGNNRATMTMAIASYNITAGGWRELQDQLGIDRAFLTLNFPDVFGDIGMMVWNVGVFGDRYGAMGKYDGGAYDTYMIGRTRIAGATGTFDFDLADNFKLIVEGGGGAKMDVQQWHDSSYMSWQPFPGHAQMGTTVLTHAHIGGVLARVITLTGHFMRTWTADAMRTDTNTAYAARNGSMRILGVDLRLDGGWLGDGYLGFSSIKTANVGVLSDTVEVIHSQGGWQYQANYTGSHGDSTVNSIGLQYTFSLAAFMQRPQAWWGQGADFTVQVFGMCNFISGVAADDQAAIALQGTRKLKLGTQLLYSPLPFLAVGFRFDSVQPNMDDATHNFWVLSPRLVFRTAFVTREQIIIQYQYYSYGSWYANDLANSLPFPYGQTGSLWVPTRPDRHTLTVAASMWW